MSVVEGGRFLSTEVDMRPEAPLKNCIIATLVDFCGQKASPVLLMSENEPYLTWKIGRFSFCKKDFEAGTKAWKCIFRDDFRDDLRNHLRNFTSEMISEMISEMNSEIISEIFSEIISEIALPSFRKQETPSTNRDAPHPCLYIETYRDFRVY